MEVETKLCPYIDKCEDAAIKIVGPQIRVLLRREEPVSPEETIKLLCRAGGYFQGLKCPIIRMQQESQRPT